MTDAPNAIVSCVSTKCLSLNKAVLIAAVSDFIGSLLFGLLNGKVTATVIDIAAFNDSENSLVGFSCAMFTVVIWALAAWYFGFPTSESHALLAALAGSGCAVNGSFVFNYSAWYKVIFGLIISVAAGFAAGYIAYKFVAVFDDKNNDRMFRNFQIGTSVLMSFMHGAQDSQKFTGVIMLAVSSLRYTFDYKSTPLIYLLCPLFISFGTLAGGERIIKTVGSDMVMMDVEQGFSSDFAGAICLLVTTLMGMPVSTTHTKTSAVLGAGVAKDSETVNFRIAGEMVAAWIATFPFCGLLSFVVTKIILVLIK